MLLDDPARWKLERKEGAWPIQGPAASIQPIILMSLSVVDPWTRRFPLG
jgi:hypothetical protein